MVRFEVPVRQAGWRRRRILGNQEEAPQVAGQCSPALLRESVPVLPGHFILGRLAVLGPLRGRLAGMDGGGARRVVDSPVRLGRELFRGCALSLWWMS
jgi:hypothetical protein